MLLELGSFINRQFFWAGPLFSEPKKNCLPIGSMYGIYANIGGILMGSMLPYIAYMDPLGYQCFSTDCRDLDVHGSGFFRP